MLRRRAPVLRLGSRGRGVEEVTKSLCVCVCKRPRVSRILGSRNGRETQNCRHFLGFVLQQSQQSQGWVVLVAKRRTVVTFGRAFGERREERGEKREERREERGEKREETRERERERDGSREDDPGLKFPDCSRVGCYYLFDVCATRLHSGSWILSGYIVSCMCCSSASMKDSDLQQMGEIGATSFVAGLGH